MYLLRSWSVVQKQDWHIHFLCLSPAGRQSPPGRCTHCERYTQEISVSTCKVCIREYAASCTTSGSGSAVPSASQESPPAARAAPGCEAARWPAPQ